MKRLKHHDQIELFSYIGAWLVTASLIALLAGTASAVFLLSLDNATAWRESHSWMIWLLPLAGLLVGLVYSWYGEPVNAGNNLIIDEIHDPRKVVPIRMVPLVLGGTLMSHLFGASVGREGTAVQMGGALADQLTHMFKVKKDARRILLMAGMSAGFSSVFGTPMAGAIFGMEVLAIGRIRYDALFPCLVAAVLADQVCLAWGVHHTHYRIDFIPAFTIWSFLSVVIAGAVFGLAGMVFSVATGKASGIVKRYIKYAPLRPFFGGILIAAAVWFIGTDRYIGLGIPEIVRAFKEPLYPRDFMGKMSFTIVSLATGFKGGEVTPLFYIGATLGNALAPLLHMPFAFMAGIGFVAVFAGAANTPLATTFMAMELFGTEMAVFSAVGCFTAYLFSGHTGIYHAQRVGHAKSRRYRTLVPSELRISEISAVRRKKSFALSSEENEIKIQPKKDKEVTMESSK